jgi:hypothetical protein
MKFLRRGSPGLKNITHDPLRLKSGLLFRGVVNTRGFLENFDERLWNFDINHYFRRCKPYRTHLGESDNIFIFTVIHQCCR